MKIHQSSLDLAKPKQTSAMDLAKRAAQPTASFLALPSLGLSVTVTNQPRLVVMSQATTVVPRPPLACPPQ